MATDPEITTRQGIALARDTGKLVCSPYIGAGYRSLLRPYDRGSACLHAHRTWQAAFVCLVQREVRANRLATEDARAAGL